MSSSSLAPNHPQINSIMNISNLIRLISTQPFADWYNDGGNFDRWIQGDLPEVSKDQVKQDLAEMLKRYKVMEPWFTSAILLTGFGADKISLNTTLPSPFPAVSSQPLTLNFEVEAGKGKEYVGKHFPGLMIEEIDRTKGKIFHA